MRGVKENSIFTAIYHFIVPYKGPLNFTYYFNFGLLALICLVVQIASGVFLAMHYDPSMNNAFDSVENIMREVKLGSVMRYTHANGASMFFMVVYIHMLKAMYAGSFLKPRHWVWIVGVFMLLFMVMTAFFGYVLPWGQMSFWAATVITSFLTAMPSVGYEIAVWIWGGFSVSEPTLNRIYSFHFLFPFIISLLVFLHLLLLHTWGSNNPSGFGVKSNAGSFTPHYMVKDAMGVCFFYMFASYFMFFAPNALGHPDNYIPANPYVTPPHIVPEWYFLPFYAILRSIPNKLFGVIALVASILVLVLLPYIISERISSGKISLQYQWSVWGYILICLILGYIGGKPMEFHWYILGQYFTVMYFYYILFCMPMLSRYELSELIAMFSKYA